jgi:hypothetical protein
MEAINQQSLMTCELAKDGRPGTSSLRQRSSVEGTAMMMMRAAKKENRYKFWVICSVGERGINETSFRPKQTTYRASSNLFLSNSFS